MNPKELRGLYEAYSKVYAPQEVDEEYIDEAEGSYGQTPKARAAMGKVAIARREKPASEYSQKGEKTRKVKEIEKHTQRIDNGPDVGNRGKKSTKPRWSGFAGKSGRGKLDQDSRDYSRETSAEYGSGTSGSGTVTKSAKKLRKQKAMGEIGEGYDIFDVVLEFLQVEGYAETLEEAEWMMANVIDEEAIDIILGEAIYSEKGKAKAAEMIAKRSTPSGRAKSGKGANVAHIRQIRGSGRGDFDREGLGGTPMTPTMAKNPIKKQNYVGTGNKAARRAGLTPTREKPNAWKEEFEFWVDALVEEGYDLSGYTWDEMYEFYLDEAEGSYGATPKAYSAASKTKMTAKRKPFLKKMQSRTNPANRTDPYGSPRKGLTADDRERARAGSAHGVGTRQDHDYPSEGPGGVTKSAKKLRKQKAMGEFAKEAFEAWLDEAMTNYEKNRKRAAQRAAARNAARDQGKTGAVPGVGYVTPRRERETWTDESGKTRHAKGL